MDFLYFNSAHVLIVLKRRHRFRLIKDIEPTHTILAPQSLQAPSLQFNEMIINIHIIISSIFLNEIK